MRKFEAKFDSLRQALWWRLHSCRFASCGPGASIHRSGDYHFENIVLGDGVFINRDAVMWAVNSRIIIGNKVVMGPQVTFMAGNHNTSVMGSFMIDVKTKRPQDDRDITVEEDVWIGCGAVILTGVTIGRGAVVGAGAVVTRDVPAYSVVTGSSASVRRFRWTPEQTLEHEAALYPAEMRYTLAGIRQQR